MAELVDALASGASGSSPVEVQVLSPVPENLENIFRDFYIMKYRIQQSLYHHNLVAKFQAVSLLVFEL